MNQDLAEAQGPLSALFSSAVEPNRKVRGNGTSDWLRLAWIVLQFALVAVAVDRFQVGSQAFTSLTKLAFGGFLIHALLPLRFRLAFFCLLSVAGIFLVLSPLGASLLVNRHVLWLLALGMALIGLCHLRVRLVPLILVLLAACGLLAAMRGGWIQVPWSDAIWPVLGSMFMFRTMMFVYDKRHGEPSRSLWETCSYFFLLPNVCFPLFPTVDYKTYRRSWYAQPELDCYQTGIQWMLRGIVQLLFYRFVYYYGVVAPGEVSTTPELLQYLLANISLYLRVSGTFHVIVGMCRMFGFALPETHFLYFLSTSVNDFWRRANIYWKDFMVKVWYFPAYFKLRKGGEVRAFVLATIFVVLATWVLHSYQVYWLAGHFPIHWQDGVFWAFLGVFMVINTLQERKSSGARGRRARTWSLTNALGQSWRIALTFSVLACIWSLWTCRTFGEWVDMWTLQGSGAEASGLAEAWIVLPALLGVLLLEGLGGNASPGGPGLKGKGPSPLRVAGFSTASLVALLALGEPGVYDRAGEHFSDTMQSLRSTKLNRLDAAKLQRGYYEDLLDVDRLDSELARVMKSKPKSWKQLHETPALRPRADFQLTELVPESETLYKEAPLVVNAWGMRDKPYDKEKPANTTRVALLGASYVMGSGVPNDATFEALLEERWNADSAAGRRFEILNFAVGGFSPMQRMGSLEERALAFDPDLALYIAHENEAFRIERHLVTARQRGIEIPYPELREILARAELSDEMTDQDYERAIEPLRREILGWTYARIAATCKARGIRPVWVFLPTLEMHGTPTDIDWMFALAREAGFETVSLFDVFEDVDVFAVRIAPWDYHPNEDGHRRIADALQRAFEERPELLPELRNE